MKKGRKSNSEKLKDNIAKMDKIEFQDEESVIDEVEEENLDAELDFENHHFSDEFMNNDDYE